MAIKKQVIKSRPVVKVTFSVDAKKAEHVFVVGDFNNWNAEEGILSKLKSGLFKASFEVPKDNSYEFKYIIDGEYVNESQADCYKWNTYANAENSVLEV